MSEHLSDTSAAEREAQVQALAERYLDQLQAGQTPDRAALVAAHPQIAALLEQRLALVEIMHRLAQLPASQHAADASDGPGAGQAHSSGTPSPEAPVDPRATQDDVPPVVPPPADDAAGEASASPPPGPRERSKHVKCPHCGNRIQLVEPVPHEVICQSCGSSFQVETRATTSYHPGDLPATIGKFVILELLGRGAFGAVYKARDPELDRTVAIKVPRAGYFTTPQEQERFLREARSTAQLNHPHIVAVHEIGHEQGVPYIVSDYIEGLTLADRLTGGRPSFREAAELLAQLADALAYAHQAKIIHRDIKPSNILLDVAGRPHLTDFGLARRDEGEITVTLEGQILGTPAYMSPEQASGNHRQVDGRSDVYSLGVVLYELLTGELPFRGNKRMLLHQVLHDEPRAPRSLNDRVPLDLQTICLKAMAKEPHRRYTSARDLADDVQRYLQGEPIRARPVRAWERAWRWAKRRPVAAALVVVSGVAALALVGLIVASMYSTRLERALDDTEEARQEAVAQRQRAEQSLDQARLYQYYHHIALAYAGWQAGDLVQMGPLLEDCPPERRHWEWHYLQRLRHSALFTTSLHPSIVIDVAFSPDGTRLATCGLPGMVKVLDAATGRELLSLKGHPDDSQVWGVAFSPDGARLASVGTDRLIRVWDLASGRELLALPGHGNKLNSVAFNRDGTQMVSASRDGTVRVWEAATGRLVHTLKGHKSHVSSAAFSPDGTQIASVSHDQTTRLWDAATGREVHALSGHLGQVNKAAFSPNGAWLASAGDDRTIIVWDPKTGQPLRTLTGHTGPVWSVAFSPEGNRLASAAVDQTVRLWDLATGREELILKGHSSEVLSVAFSPDGARLASGSADGTVKTWDTKAGPEARTLRGHANAVCSVVCSPDGQWIASGSYDRTVKLWDAVTGQDARTLRGHEGRPGNNVAFSPSGQWLASTSADRTVKLWEAVTGREVQTLKGHGKVLWCVAFSPDGTRLASGGEDRMVRLWDVVTGQELCTLPGHTGRIRGVAFSADGNRVASVSADTTAQVWDVATGQLLLTLRGHLTEATGVTYSPDGALLATTAEDNALRIWDTATGQQLHKLDGHSGTVYAVAFSPDGRRLASASSDNTVRIWDTNTWREALTLRGHTAEVLSVAFSPDGTQLVSSSTDGTVKIWDARPVTPEAAAERAALGLLEYLFARPLSRDAVVEHLRTAPALPPRAREIALALVERYAEETDPERFHRSGWAIVRQPYLNAFQYRFALRQAETASRLVPEQARYRTTLGMAQYRAGHYPQARATLIQAEPLHQAAAAGLVVSPVSSLQALATLWQADQQRQTLLANRAFLAMTHHQLGEKEKAHAVLDCLRQLLKTSQGTKDDETQSHLREAMRLIVGKVEGAHP